MSLAERINNVRAKVPLESGQQRLAEAILYIAKRSEDDERFSAIKLNKILFKADFDSYAERNRPVTGRLYQKLRLGPAPQELVPLRRDMMESGEIKIESRKYYGYSQERVVALRDPNRSLFSDEDLHYLDQAIDELWDLNAEEASTDSHGVQWRTRNLGDPIPYETAYLSDEKVSPEQERRIIERSLRLGWHMPA